MEKEINMGNVKKALIDISGRSNSGPVIALELAKAFAENGYDVYAVVAKDALNVSDWFSEKSIKEIYILKTYTNMKDVFPKSIEFQCKEKKLLKQHFKGVKFDFVIKPIFHIWAEGIAAQVEKKEIITICHDPIMHSGENALKHILYKRHIKNSDEIVVLTKSFIPIVSKNYGFPLKKIHYMPHGLMKLYKEKQDKTIKCMYDSQHINYVFFGRIEKYKGVDVLIRAYEKLREQNHLITLTIAGKGKIGGIDLQSNDDKKIRIINDYIPDNQVGCYFDGPNVVVVLPYLDATQSGVIPIAMEYGTPIIASETGGLKEQMQDGKFGVFTKPGDFDDLAEKMKLFVENKELFNQQKSLMEAAMKELEWKKVVSELLKKI